MVATETRRFEQPGPDADHVDIPDYSVSAMTEAGRSLVALAEEVSADFATRAGQHDREGSFPVENLEVLKRTAFLYAPIPIEHGGLGVDSVHDVLVAASRLARGDASLAIGVNMHLTVLLALSRQLNVARARGNRARMAEIAALMRHFVRSGAVIAAAVSEKGQDLTRQKTLATFDGSRWILNGRKIVSSMAPVATYFSVSTDYLDANGTECYAFALVPAGLPGVKVHDDWDGLGMRASASSTVTFTDCRIPDSPGRGAIAGMVSSDYLKQFLVSGGAHAAASVGILESAHQLGIRAVTERRQRPGNAFVSPSVQLLAAENAIDVSASRAVFSRALLLIDRYYAGHPSDDGTLDELNALFSEVQQAKAYVNQASLRVVDRAMTMTGGNAYMNSHPLSRLFRDARAGSFMHPLGANVAHEYVGAVTLGLRPTSL